MARKETRPTRKVTKYRAVVREYYDITRTLADNLDDEAAARDPIDKERKVPYRLATLHREFKVVPYTTRVPCEGLPKEGDLMYVLDGLERLVDKPGLVAQIGIKGGLSEVAKVYEEKKGSGEWLVYFDKIAATYKLNDLISIQKELKTIYGSQDAEPIIDLNLRKRIEDEAFVRDALEDDRWDS